MRPGQDSTPAKKRNARLGEPARLTLLADLAFRLLVRLAATHVS